jgi:hypothetical protein
MAKPNPTNLLSQEERQQYRQVLNDSRLDLPWRTRAAGDVLPCEGMPLCGDICGVASAAMVLSVLRGESQCPMNRPTGCPFKKPPSS